MTRTNCFNILETVIQKKKAKIQIAKRRERLPTREFAQDTSLQSVDALLPFFDVLLPFVDAFLRGHDAPPTPAVPVSEIKLNLS